MKFRFFITFVFFLTSFVCVVESAKALEAGLSNEYRQIGRLHSDSDSIGSEITTQTSQIFVEEELGNFSLRFTEESLVYQLRHPDRTLYFKTTVIKHNPKVSYWDETWKFSLSLSQLSIDQKDGFYKRLNQDKKSTFTLGALSGQYSQDSFFIGTSLWEESDFFSFNYHHYSFFLYNFQEYYLGYNLDEYQKVKITTTYNDRIYPEGFGLPKDKTAFLYKWDLPVKFGDQFEWSYFQLDLSQTEILDVNVQEHYMENLFSFHLLGFKHFINYRLTYINWLTTYREGLSAYTLIEQYSKLNDISQTLNYSAFRRIGQSNWFLAYAYRLHDSLVKEVRLDQAVDLKIVYNFY